MQLQSGVFWRNRPCLERGKNDCIVHVSAVHSLETKILRTRLYHSILDNLFPIDLWGLKTKGCPRNLGNFRGVGNGGVGCIRQDGGPFFLLSPPPPAIVKMGRLSQSRLSAVASPIRSKQSAFIR